MIYAKTDKAEKGHRRKMINKKETYRSIFLCCMVFTFMMLFIGLETERWEVTHCYGILYNRVYFSSIYLILYLIGLFPVVNRMLLPEIAVRYTNKSDFALRILTKIVWHSFLYSLTFLTVNVIVFFILCTDDFDKSTVGYLFFLLAFISQFIGWILIGCLFLLFYMAFQHIVIAFLITIMLLAGTTSIIYIEIRNPYEGYYKVYSMMYYFYEQENIFHIVKYLTYYLCLIMAVQLILYWFLKRKDFIKRKRR